MIDNRKRAKYFDITGEMILEMLKGRSNIPPDAYLKFSSKIDVDQLTFLPHNVFRFVITSEEFEEIPEGGSLPRFDVVGTSDK